MGFYKEEVFSKHIKYVEDTVNNRLKLTELYGDNLMGRLPYSSYIEINIQKKSWRICFDFEWLYRDVPPLIKIEEL